MSKELAIAEPKSEVAVIFEKINTGLQAFEARKEELTTLKSKAEGLKIESLEDKQTIKQVGDIRKELKKARVEIENEGKAMRDPLTKINKSISEKEKELVGIIEPTEKALLTQERWVKDEEARIEAEEKRKEDERIQNRIDVLAQFGYAIDINFLKGLDDQQFEKVVENARIENEKDQAAKAEQARKEQEEREQAEKDRAELKALREKQEAADKILREREEEIARKEAELERERIANRRDLVNRRLYRLNNVSFDGQEIRWKFDNSILLSGWDSILDPSEEAFTAFVVAHNEKNEAALHEVYLAEERKKKEEEEKRQQQLEEARKEAAEKALAEQKERDAEQARQEAERLAQSSDKEKFDVILSHYNNTPWPEMKSAKHKKLLAEVKELNAKVIAHIKGKA
jgi:hypothetical protein